MLSSDPQGNQAISLGACSFDKSTTRNQPASIVSFQRWPPQSRRSQKRDSGYYLPFYGVFRLNGHGASRTCLISPDFGLAITQNSQVQLHTDNSLLLFHGVWTSGGTRKPKPVTSGQTSWRYLRIWVHMLGGRVPTAMLNHQLISFQMCNGAHPWYLDSPVAGARFMTGSRPSRPMDEICMEQGLDDDMWDFIQNL